MKFEAIIFDLDGVIVSTDHYHYLAWKALADELGISFDERDNEKLRGVSRMESLDIILEKSDKSYSIKEKEEMAEKKNNIYKQYLCTLTKDNLPISVFNTLIQLKEQGIFLAVGSSSKNTKMILSQLEITDLFDAISDGTMITYSKPHPEVFMKAADLLNVNYKNCLVVEDALSGCIAAKSASMKVAAINSAYNCQYADYHLNDFSDLLYIVKENV